MQGAAANPPALVFREFFMKLQLISASVVAYTILTMACICYAELAIP
jgi:hypothetical protein